MSDQITDKSNGMEIVWKQAPGDDGATVEDVQTAALKRLREHQAKLPCRENAIAITKMQEVLFWLRERTERRERAGIAGTMHEHRS